MRQQLQSLIESIDRSTQLFFFDIDGHKVLFRIDGMIVTVSDVIFDLLATYRGLSVPERFSLVAKDKGEDELDAALRSLAAFDATGVFTEEIPELQPPDVSSVQPSGILLMVTQTCNLACTYCYAGGGTYGSNTKLLSPDKAEAAIDSMIARAPDRASYTVTFFGGEPLLNFPLVKRVVDYCKQKGRELGKAFGYSMTTNATVVTPEIVSFLAENGFTVMVSYDGAQAQESNRPFEHGQESNTIVMRNIKQMTEAGLPVQLRATLVKDMVNREQIDGLVQIGKSLGAKKITMSPVSTTKNALFPAHEELVLSEEDHRRLGEIYRTVTDENLAAVCEGSADPVTFDPHLHMVKALARGNAVGMGQCGACFGMSAVSTQGKIYPCHRFVGMDDYAIGDLEQGVNSGRVEDFFARAARAAHEKCSTCWVRLMCTGGCYYHNADGRGDFVSPEDATCDGFRDTVKHAIGHLLRLRVLPKAEAQRYYRATSSL